MLRRDRPRLLRRQGSLIRQRSVVQVHLGPPIEYHSHQVQRDRRALGSEAFTMSETVMPIRAISGAPRRSPLRSPGTGARGSCESQARSSPGEAALRPAQLRFSAAVRLCTTATTDSPVSGPCWGGADPTDRAWLRLALTDGTPLSVVLGPAPREAVA